MISKLPASQLLAPLVVVAGLFLVGCGSDGDTSVALTSDERPAQDAGDEDTSAATDVSEYCDQAQQLADSDAELAQDPAAGIERLESLKDVAPDELEDDFDVLADVVQQLSALDEDDPESFEQIITIAFDPEVLAASDAISSYTFDECGIDLDSAVSGGVGSDDDVTTSTPGTSDDEFEDGSDPTDLHISDVEDVRAALGGSWSDKLSGTVISGGADVQVSAMDDALLTADEALAACNALMAGLGQKNPAVSVKVFTGETLLAEAPAGGTCAQV